MNNKSNNILSDHIFITNAKICLQWNLLFDIF